MARELTPLTYDEADEIVHRLVGNDALSAEMAARLLLAVRDGDAPSAAGASETGPSGVDSALEIRLRDDAERLRSALRVHGAHSSSCDILMLLTSDPPLRKPCSCGLAAALAVPAPIAVRADAAPAAPLKPVHWHRWAVIGPDGDCRRLCLTEGDACETACGDEEVQEVAVYPVDAPAPAVRWEDDETVKAAVGALYDAKGAIAFGDTVDARDTARTEFSERVDALCRAVWRCAHDGA